MGVETKFTPGPWSTHIVSDDPSYGYEMIVVGAEPVGAPWQVCAVNGFDDESGESRANAHLIAAAPELYEALNWLVHVDHGVGKAGLKPEEGEQKAALQAGIAALAKARGGES